MTTLAKDAIRTYESGPGDLLNDLPVVGSDIIFEGAAVSVITSGATGYAQPLVAGDPFLGFSKRKSDNSAGSNGDRNVHVIERGKVLLDVVGVTGVADIGKTVYAADDDTFTLTSTDNTAIGKITRYVSGTWCVVY
ncbi:MAG: cytoplasmic protein, partial [Phototrophicales bacterium]